MARIMKVRTIPRGYVQMDELKELVFKQGKTPAEWFMSLFSKFGNPQREGQWSYLLRHNGLLIKVIGIDNELIECGVWVSPSIVQEAKRKYTKVMNVIARRLNDENKVFVPKDGDKLYYLIRKKNEELLSKMKGKTIKDINMELTDKESKALYGGLGQYMTDAKEEITNTIKEIFNGE